MSEDLARRRLGRGLAALIGEIERPQPEPTAPAPDGRVPVAAIHPNKRNPRRSFAEAELADLAQSIREHGLVQPIVVRRRPDGEGFEIVAGERRWRAARQAGLADVPVIVRDVNDRTALELAIIENVQRADLNPLEEALGYQQLIDEHSYTQADLGQVIGKSRSHVANTLRLLKLPEEVRDMLTSGLLSAGHARTLVTAADPAGLARRIVDDGLSVRQAEALAQAPAEEATTAGKRPSAEKDADTKALEKLLGDAMGMRVAINHKQRGGELRISYRSLEQLDDLCRRLKG
ncbi:MAG TPA: ParB/RepB/Spo0J family partition protein [Mesorhizobium sp.]|jgi:ParB family chromosome partitioning protein|nr:ParB/RepB/Spo0J family partition protein [Mesorhizobium sp.]